MIVGRVHISAALAIIILIALVYWFYLRPKVGHTHE